MTSEAMTRTRATHVPETPFREAELDRLMDEAGIEVLLATSKHNVQYLSGGHRSHFYACCDAIGLTRYLPILVYPKGAPGSACYIGDIAEADQLAVSPIWPATIDSSAHGTLDAVRKATQHLKGLATDTRCIGIEPAFIPSDTKDELQRQFPDAQLVDATLILERLRARKTSHELSALRTAAERIIASMVATISAHGPGSTKLEIAQTLRVEQAQRGLDFAYCLMSVGASHNRGLCDQPWLAGEPLNIDSGGSYDGYVGDLARMAVLGDPDSELEELLAQVHHIQMVARAQVRPGNRGGEIYAHVDDAMRAVPEADHIQFVAHGMGLINHEAPRLTATGPVPYPATHVDDLLQAGMVLSIETTLLHPSRGLIKIEDTVAVTPEGSQAFGDENRGWNQGKM